MRGALGGASLGTDDDGADQGGAREAHLVRDRQQSFANSHAHLHDEQSGVRRSSGEIAFRVALCIAADEEDEIVAVAARRNLGPQADCVQSRRRGERAGDGVVNTTMQERCLGRSLCAIDIACELDDSDRRAEMWSSWAIWPPTRVAVVLEETPAMRRRDRGRHGTQ